MSEVRCKVRRWPMRPADDVGCKPGDCCYRPTDPDERARLARRRQAIAAGADPDAVEHAAALDETDRLRARVAELEALQQARDAADTRAAERYAATCQPVDGYDSAGEAASTLALVEYCQSESNGAEVESIEDALCRAYRAGAESMRERAAVAVDEQADAFGLVAEAADEPMQRAAARAVRLLRIAAGAIRALPLDDDAREDAENCCEHGDHPAPKGMRFCSKACQECESTGQPSGRECAGICDDAREDAREDAQGGE